MVILPIGDFLPQPKPQHNRGKPSRKQKSELPPKEDKKLKERSGEWCEKCRKLKAVNKAHLARRWRSERIPTVKDFAHLCFSCHTECDNTPEGRNWLSDFKEVLDNEKRFRN